MLHEFRNQRAQRIESILNIKTHKRACVAREDGGRISGSIRFMDLNNLSSRAIINPFEFNWPEMLRG